MSDWLKDSIPAHFWIEKKIPEGLERIMCRECGTLHCDTYVPDVKRHRYWHKAVAEIRAVHGRHLLGPDEVSEARYEAMVIFNEHPDAPLSTPFSLRVDAVLLFVLTSHCQNIYANYNDGNGSWAEFCDFDEYVRWHVIECKGFYVEGIIRNADAVYKEILHRLKVIPYISTSIYDHFFAEENL